ncbi:hypothetical protein Tco_0109169 [Tanacetum coccineum]
MAENGELEEDEVQEFRPMDRDKAKKKAFTSYIPSALTTTSSDEALAKLLVNEFTSQQSSFMSLKETDRNAF